jgi:hypothetical protein
MNRVRWDERGEITIAGWAIIATILFVGPTVIVGVGSLFGPDDPPRIGGARLDTPTVAGPAPPDNQCAMDAYSSFGLQWNNPVPGWSIPGHNPPDPSEPDYSNKLRIYKAVITERVTDARSLWIERDCHKPQDPIDNPAVTPLPTEPVALNINGVYATAEDIARSSYDLPDVEGSIGCAGRAIPPEMTFSVNGTNLTAVVADTPGQPAYSNNGTFDPGSGAWYTTYPDGGRYLIGRFFVSGDKILLSDGIMYTGDCALAFTGEKK